ncbi:MAG: ATP phosphoribosyltransferase regulatory subunit [Leptospiraceae bacterium]|nr:ATP phosphoribosyltransferase regulatory subunit [Leptospiraceae bacterium]MDW7975407.1 ATP phosphoribosyltransferase regulatory subunit [Leptospiraceae bacterium]
MHFINKYASIPSGIEYFSLKKTKIFNQYKKKAQEWLESQGFIEFIPPLFDFIDLFLINTNSFLNGKSFYAEKLFEVKDSNGELLSLRSDITVMAMKSFLFQTQMIEKIQYYYIQPVYRDFSKGAGFHREIYQIGVEWIGNYEHRVEKLYQTSKELLKIFPFQFTFVVGNSLFMKHFLELYPKEALLEILTAFYFKDKYKLKEIIKKHDISRKLADYLLEIPFLVGKKEVLKEWKRILSQKPELLEIVKNTIHELSENDTNEILFDFSLVREFDYYTGFIIEAYCQNTNKKILSGGIYDHFSLQLSHHKVPACGFAINFSELINSIEVIE